MLRGEVWTMSLDAKNAKNTKNTKTAKTAESSRMVIILSNDALAVLPLRVIVPLTSWKDSYAGTPWLVRVPPVLNSGIEGVMAADALQVRSVSTSRLKTRLGDLPERLVDEIAVAVAMVVKA